MSRGFAISGGKMRWEIGNRLASTALYCLLVLCVVALGLAFGGR